MMTKKIQKNIEEYFVKNFPKKKFVPGESSVPVSGKVFDEKELLNGVEAVLDGWWTEGRLRTSLRNFSESNM